MEVISLDDNSLDPQMDKFFYVGEKLKNYDQYLIIDIDILDFNGKISHSDELTVPHPRIEMRNFVLIPLAEIAPNWIHPLLKRPVNKVLL